MYSPITPPVESTKKVPEKSTIIINSVPILFKTSQGEYYNISLISNISRVKTQIGYDKSKYHTVELVDNKTFKISEEELNIILNLLKGDVSL